jgi:phasin family protein
MEFYMITLEQITQAQKAALESAFTTGAQLFTRAESLLALNVATAKQAYGAAASHASETLSAKDPQSFVSLQVGAVQPAGEQAVAYGKQAFAISQAAVADLSKVYEATAANTQEKATEWFEAAAKNAPAGYESVFGVAKNFVEASKRMSAYAQDAATKAAGAFETVVKQAQTNMATVTPINAFAAATGTKAAKRK